jgi:hypothetical protein
VDLSAALGCWELAARDGSELASVAIELGFTRLTSLSLFRPDFRSRSIDLVDLSAA